MKRLLPLIAALALSGCGDAPDESETTTANIPGEVGPDLPPPPAAPSPEDLAKLNSKDCAEVAQFYFEAIGGRDFERAALVWDDPVIDGARLEALFGAYKEAQIEWTEPFVEGAAGSLYCTVSGKLTDAGDLAKPPREGTLLLRRANEVPGATPDQLRWTIRSSTFIEPMERAGTGEGA